MITVYVWLSRQMNDQKNVGHASMSIGGHTYISWWPCESASIGQDFSPIRNKNYNSDLADEGCPPDASIEINGLNESAIINWWQSFGLVKDNMLLQGPMLPYNIMNQNCSTVVAMALKIGGADRYSSWYSSWSIVWRPQTILDYANSIKKGTAGKN